MSEEVKKFFNTYTDFVTKVTSDPSLDLQALSESFKKKSTGLIFIPVDVGTWPLGLFGSNLFQWISAQVSFRQCG